VTKAKKERNINTQEIKSEPNENESPKMLKLIIAQARPPTKKYLYIYIKRNAKVTKTETKTTTVA